jgi:BRCT domain type II-containing protein
MTAGEVRGWLLIGMEGCGGDKAVVRARFDALSGVCICHGTSHADVATSRTGVPSRDGAANFLRFIRCATTKTTAAFSLSSSSSSSIALHSLSDGASLTCDTVDLEPEDEASDEEDSRRRDGVSARTTKPG